MALRGCDQILPGSLGALTKLSSLTHLDLSGCNLSQAHVDAVFDSLRVPTRLQLSLQGAILEGLDLSGRDFCGVDMQRANLSRAVLAGADLRSAVLTGCNLSFSDLRGAQLPRALLLLDLRCRTCGRRSPCPACTGPSSPIPSCRPGPWRPAEHIHDAGSVSEKVC